jgi:ABC-2 type transport system ATP-binding protein
MISHGNTTVFGVKIDNLTTGLIGKIKSLEMVTAVSQQDDYNLKVSAQGENALNLIIDTIRSEGGNIVSVTNSNESTLEDVFLAVTGKEMRDQANEKPSYTPHRHGMAPKARVR